MKQVDEEKILQVLSEITEVFNKHNLNIPEIILTYGNLGYHLGASIGNFKSPGPQLEELQKEYYSNPTVDVGLALQGLLITTWEKDFISHPRLSRFNPLPKQEEKKE